MTWRGGRASVNYTVKFGGETGASHVGFVRHSILYDRNLPTLDYGNFEGMAA